MNALRQWSSAELVIIFVWPDKKSKILAGNTNVKKVELAKKYLGKAYPKESLILNALVIISKASNDVICVDRVPYF